MNEPKQIDDQRAANIIGCYSRKQQTGDQSDYGLYYLRAPDGIFVAIDNSTGHCWVEEFSNFSEARQWLLAG